MRSTRILVATLALTLIGASTGQSMALVTTSLPHSLGWNADASQPDLIKIAQKKPAAKGKSKSPARTTAKSPKKPSPTAKKKATPNVNARKVNNVRIVKRPGGWRGRHWGATVFGVTLGTIIIVAANTPPPLPDPSLCWTWTNSALTQGYWYYCVEE
jgi:hypothetical protein